MSLFPKKYDSYEDIINNYNNTLLYKTIDLTMKKIILSNDFNNNYYNGINKLINNKQIIMIHSKEDTIVSCTNYEDIIKKNGIIFNKGVHSKIFDLEENQYYIDEIIKKYNEFYLNISRNQNC
jgi:hypothetical protein